MKRQSSQSPNIFHRSLLRADLLIALALAAAAFALYALTAVPGVLDGDQGELQYMPAVLGIPHPSGFPLYLLLGHVWSWLPLGSLALRMNLFSGFWGALTVAALFLVLRRQRVHLAPALAAALTLAVIPQFWQYSTVAAVYRLHDFLIVLFFGFLAEWEQTREDRFLRFAALAFGFDLANHLTVIFFAPFTLLFLFLIAGREWLRPRLLLSSAALLLAPLLLYLYFPVRAAQLGFQHLFPGWSTQVSRGIVSPFYPNDPSGLFSYFVGGAFYSSVAGHWQWTPDKLMPGLLTTVFQTINWPLALLSLIGAIWLYRSRPRLAVWLIGTVALFLVLAVQYTLLGLEAIGQFSSYAREYYLPAFILLVVLAAWALDALQIGIERLAQKAPARIRAALPATAALAIVLIAIPTASDLASHRSTALNTRSAEVEARWQTVRQIPPDPNAILVGHWGDLTPLWYYQYAENWRADLQTIHPPDVKLIAGGAGTGRSLYLAGPLLDWAPGLADKYLLTPWGPLVRVDSSVHKPDVQLAQAAAWKFSLEKPMIELLGYQVASTTLHAGSRLDVTAYWHVLEGVSLDDCLVYFSLVNKETSTEGQGQTLAVDWLPGGKLETGGYALSHYSYTAPTATPPGAYRVKLWIYSTAADANLQISGPGTDGDSVELGEIAVGPREDK